jgi:thiosulfate dehydrogenase [quinone] large subunit
MAITVAARVAVGALWLAEAIVKYRAGFGAADILLVADSTRGNSRTPWWFPPVETIMNGAPALMGFAIPLLELLLGVTLVIGFLPRWAAFLSIGTLMLYWGSDQLISQYPLMVVLSAVVLALPGADCWSVMAWLRRRSVRLAGHVDAPQPARPHPPRAN